MAARYRQSYAGVGEMLRADFMLAEMLRRAEAVKERGEDTSPVDEGGPHPGRYKASFSVEGDRRGGHRHDRAVGRVTNDAPEAVAVEFGNKNTPQHATMRNALDAAAD